MKKATVVISLRDNYTAVMKKARRYTSAFNKDVQKMTARLDAASKKKHDIRVKNSAAMKAMNALEKKIAPMRNVMVKVAAHIQHFKHQIKPVTDTFKKIATRAWTITLKVKDGVSFVLTKINTALKKVGKGIAIGAAAVLGVGGYAIGKGMELENYQVAMKHFVGINNPNANTEQIQNQTDQYLGWLRQNAKATPFGASEVIQAGSRAVGVTGGNTAAAQGLVRMAEDMASLTPGKTIMDAMEALADAQMGEFERMKEFNFKMYEKDLKKNGYDLFSTKGRNGKTLAETFGGGTEVFANTPAGKMAQITGELESEIADMGYGMAQQLIPTLEWIQKVVLPDLKKWIFEPAKETGKTGVQVLGEALKSTYYWLKDKIPAAIDAAKGAWAWLEKNIPVAVDWIVKTWEKVSPVLTRIFDFISNNLTAILDGVSAYFVGKTGFNLLSWLGIGGKGNKQQGSVGDTAEKGSLWSMIYKGVNSLVEKTGTGVALTSPAAGVAVANGTTALGNVLAAGGSVMLPGAYYWAQDQMNAANVNYFSKTGQKADISNIGDWLKVFAWKNVDINSQISQNTKAWGDNVNNTVDDVLGIKRLPNGLPDLGAMWGWGLKRDPVSQWAGIPGVSQTGPVGGGTNTNPVSQWGGIPGVMQSIELSPATADSVGKVADALKTPPSSGWLNISGAISAISTAATNAAATVKALIDRLAALSSTHANTGGGNHGGGGKGFAAGIKRVPSDNYPALLHKGEAVLNSAEAGEYRSNGNQQGKAGNSITMNVTVNGANMSVNEILNVIVGGMQEAAANMA